MGFGSFFSHLVKPVTKVLGPVGTAALLPAIPLTQIAANVIDVAGAKLASFAGGVGHPNVQPPGTGNVPQPINEHYYYAAPSYAAPQYPSYEPPSYGGSPWDYSTQLTTFSAPQYQTSPVYSQTQGTSRT